MPALALYGSNASGKSNVLMALGTFRDCAVSGVQGKFHPDKLHPEWRTTAFEATIVRDGKRFVYAIEYDRDEFRKESLAGGRDGAVFDRRGSPLFRFSCHAVLSRRAAGRNFPGGVQYAAKEADVVVSVGDRQALSGVVSTGDGRVRFFQ